MADVFGNQKKPVHKQGANWNVVGRYEDFESADKRRKSEIKNGGVAKVHKLSTTFVVKVKPSVTILQKEPEAETKAEKKERPAGKPKRQDRKEKK